MKTLEALKNEATLKNVTFAEISEVTTDFTNFEFLNTPFCTLLHSKKDMTGDTTYYIHFNCEDSSNKLSLHNGYIKVQTEEEYIYDADKLKANQLINL